MNPPTPPTPPTAVPVRGPGEPAGSAAAPAADAARPQGFPMRRGCPFSPPEDYARLRTEEPVARVTLPTGREAWVVSRYEDVRELLADPRISADIRRPNFPALGEGEQEVGARLRPFIRTDAPEHTRYRRMLLPEFTVRRIRAMRPAVQAIVDGLLDSMLASGGPVDFVPVYANAVSTSVICELLGIPKENLEFFRDVTRVSGSRASTAEQVAEALGGLFALISDLVARRQEEPGDDLLSKLVTGHLRTGNVTLPELLSTVGITINAGRETSTNMIALSALLLIQRPDLADELRADPSLMPAAVDELLRVMSIADSIPLRVAAQDIEISGAVVPADDGVIGLLAAANHDPEQFPDPDRVDFHRADNHHVAFGYGVHQCIGQHLARLELEVALETLIRRVPTLRLAVPYEEVEFKHDSATFGIERLPVTW
ncbi:cytochrome P450 [Sphaerisporangium sp. NPDC051011]|uniref:cytochrome P450 n=1 Tax=Sphaerisporangium sp. NPDC051011 TaxID=3155792 RepID=UPI0033FAE203